MYTKNHAVLFELCAKSGNERGGSKGRGLPTWSGRKQQLSQGALFRGLHGAAAELASVLTSVNWTFRQPSPVLG